MEITVILIVVYIFFYFSSRKESSAFDKAVNSRPKSEPYIWKNKESTAPPISIKWDYTPESKTRPKFGNMFMSNIDKKLYMRSEQWKELKLQVLTLQNNQCKLCSSTKDLHLHHLTYERLGEEELSDFVVLCSVCHQLQHDHYGMDRTTDYSVLIKPKQTE